MTPLADALTACLNLMARAKPDDPTDAALWRETQAQAAKLLAQHGQRTEERRSLARGLAAWFALGFVVAIAINLIWG